MEGTQAFNLGNGSSNLPTPTKRIDTAHQIRVALNNARHLDEERQDYIYSLCYCEHYNTGKLKECKSCSLRFNCYTRFRIKFLPL